MNSLNKTEEESVWAEQVRRDGEADLDEPVQTKRRTKRNDLRLEIKRINVRERVKEQMKRKGRGAESREAIFTLKAG